MKESCVTACPVEWPDGRGISGRMRVEWVAGSPWNRWSDAHVMGGQMTVESARLHILLRRAGMQVNHKRIYRLYRAAGLMVKRRRRRHGVAVERERLSLPSAPNQVWSMDFVFDALSTGRRIKCLTVVDDFTKEVVGILVDHGISGFRVTRALDEMGLSARHQAEADSAWQADTECVHRIIQWQVSG